MTRANDSAPQFLRRFEFVPTDADPKTRKRAIYAHASNEHIRRKRWKRGRELTNTLVTRQALPWVQIEPKASRVRLLPAAANGELVDFLPRSASTSPGSIYEQERIELERILEEQRGGPRPGLASERMDPFDSLPVPASSVQQALIEFYINEFPRFIFRLYLKQSFNPFRDLTFTTSMDNPAAFNAMLTTAAYLLASFRGDGPKEDPLALGQKGEAIQCINRALSDPKKSVSPGTLQSIIWIANVEYLWGSHEAARIHLQGLKRMLHEHGGLSTLKKHPWLEAQIIIGEQTWVFPDISLLFTDADLPCRCEEFIRFFRALRELTSCTQPYDSIVQGMVSLPDPKMTPISSDFCAIKPQSVLHRVLTLPPFHRPGGSGNLHNSQAYSHLAACFYLAATLLNLRDRRSDAKNFLLEVQQRVVDIGLVRGFSVDALFWILTIDQNRPDWRFGKRSRIWQVARLMSVTKSLAPRTQEDIKTALMRFLVPGANDDVQSVLFNPLQDSRLREFVEGCLVREMWVSCWLSSVHSR